MNKMWIQFRRWTVAATLSGYLALGLTGRIEPWLLFIGVVSTLFGNIFDRLFRRLNWYGVLWNVAAVCYMPVLFYDIFYISDLVPAMSHLLIFVQIAKYMNAKNRNDYVQIYILSFLMLMASASIYREPLFAAGLLVFTVTAVRAGILFHMVCTVNLFDPDGQPVTVPKDVLPVHGWSRRLSRTVAVFAVAALTGSVILFCIVPRVEVGFLSRPASSEAIIGYNEEIDLSTYEDLHSDNTVAFQAVLPDYPEGLPAESLFWKGISLDIYDGKRWNQVRYRHGLRFDRRRRILVGPGSSFLAGGQRGIKTVRQRIHIDFLQSRTLFGLADLTQIDLKLPHENFVYWDTWDGAWRLPNDQWTGRSLDYVGYSNLDRPTPDQLRADSTTYKSIISDIYIENGPWRRAQYNSSRVTALAKRIAGTEPTPYDKAVAIENYLKRNYTYVFDVDKTSNEMPLEDFLFYTKQGHCQYFGTAMAIMLRGLGVPARIATGYRGGSWDANTKTYTVSENMAHVWVEVYFPNYGWIEFDPSPESPELPEQSWLRRFLSSSSRRQLQLQMNWIRYVLGYDMSDQKRIAGHLSDRASAWRDSLLIALQKFSHDNVTWRNRWYKLSQSYLMAWLFAVTLVVLLIVNFFVGRRELIKETGVTAGHTVRVTPTQRKAVLLYGKMLKLLKYRRIVKPASVTPAEFARIVAEQWPDGTDDISALTRIYYTLRYARPTNDAELLAQGHHIVKLIHRRIQPNVLTRRISSW